MALVIGSSTVFEEGVSMPSKVRLVIILSPFNGFLRNSSCADGVVFVDGEAYEGDVNRVQNRTTHVTEEQHAQRSDKDRCYDRNDFYGVNARASTLGIFHGAADEDFKEHQEDHGEGRVVQKETDYEDESLNPKVTLNQGAGLESIVEPRPG